MNSLISSSLDSLSSPNDDESSWYIGHVEHTEQEDPSNHTQNVEYTDLSYRVQNAERIEYEEGYSASTYFKSPPHVHGRGPF